MRAAVKAEGFAESGGVTPDNKKKKKFNKTQLLCWVFVSLPLISYVIFNIYPVGLSFVSMFTDMKGNRIDTMQWNNFANFGTVFKDPEFWKSVGITLWLACAQFVSLFIALVIANLLEQKIKFSGLFQVLFFIPYICSGVSVGIMWGSIFNYGDGFLNSLLGTQINWLDNADYLTWCIFITIVWQAPGYGIVMYKASLRSVNPALYEAISLDGANAWHKFRYVTWPAIKPITLFLLLAGINTGLATFDICRILAPAGVDGIAGIDNMGRSLMYYIYITGTNEYFGHMQIAAVMSWFLFIVQFVACFFLIRARQKAEG